MGTDIKTVDSVPHPVFLLGQEICFANQASPAGIYLCGSLKAQAKLLIQNPMIILSLGFVVLIYWISSLLPNGEGVTLVTDEGFV